MLIEFQTERLRVRRLSHEDGDFILALLNSEGWLQFIGDRKVHSLKDATLYIERILSNPDLHYFVFEKKHDGAALGILTFIQRKELPCPDFGFATLPSYQGQGYSFEAGRKFLELLEYSGSVLAITLPSNKASKKLLHKLGFSLNGMDFHDSEKLEVYERKTD